MYFQLFFAIDRVKALASQHPEWKTTQPFQAVLEGDMKALAAAGEKGLIELVMATHAGMTTDEFEKIVTDWVTSAKHPVKKRAYTDLVYQPMLELLNYLRANGFKTYIVSGGGIEFMRPWVERVYGIPPEQVVGSSIKLKFQMEGTRRFCCASRRSTSSTTRKANRSASRSSSGAGRSPHSEIPTAISRCSSGRKPETDRGSR